MRTVGYIRCSTSEQRDSGLGLEAQRAAIEATCEARGWELLSIEQDVASGARLDRPGLQQALSAVERDKADAVVVVRLDRLSRSVSDFSRMLERFPSGIVCLDLGVDPSTPAGEMVCNVVAAMARMERRLIGERTREAMQQLKAQGRPVSGPTMPAEVRQRIAKLRAEGQTLQAIADQLTAEGVPTARGGRWYRSTIRAALR